MPVGVSGRAYKCYEGGEKQGYPEILRDEEYTMVRARPQGGYRRSRRARKNKRKTRRTRK